MLNPCPTHVDCPDGTGTESPGVNYSSEHIDVPEFPSVSYSPGPYGVYSKVGCLGRCLSYVSQEDADLCAQRQAAQCKEGDSSNAKPTYSNTQQSCTLANTGRTVIVPAGVFTAESAAEANAQALAYANKQQANGTQPPGVHIVPPPSSSGPTSPPNTIPTPVPQPPKPKPPSPSNKCKPCDDSDAVDTFSVSCEVPAGVLLMSWESPPLKCGRWTFALTTNDGGSIDDPASFVTMVLVANDPGRTYVDWGTLEWCEQMAYQNPCGGTSGCDPLDTPAFGKVQSACCSDTSYDCRWIQCQTMPDGKHYLCRLQINYSCVGGSEAPFAKKFTVAGVLTAPLPTTP